MLSRQKTAMLMAEFLGTLVLVSAILSVSVSNIGIGYFVSFAAGLALLLMVLIFGGVSGAVLNPAITIALWSARKLQTLQALLFIAVQLLGGFVAYALFTYMSGNEQLANRDTEYNTQVLVAEVVGTFVFALGVAAALYRNMSGVTKAIVIGLSLTVGIIVASANAGAGYLNPAVALGAHAWEWGTYVLGPILGAVIGVNLYNLLFNAGPANGEALATMSKPERPARVSAVSGGAKTKKTAKRTNKK